MPQQPDIVIPPIANLQRDQSLSPWRKFSTSEWQKLRKETPLALTEKGLEKLRGRGETVSLEEVKQIYIPLAQFLNLNIHAAQKLYQATHSFLGKKQVKTPYIIGLAGSVAAGKSTTARILQALLRQSNKKIEIIATDGFLFPNAILEKRNIMRRKGWPESFNQSALMHFAANIKAGCPLVQAPYYSHESYDIVPDKIITVDLPDVVIIEGLNVLQVSSDVPVILSDFFDFSIYLDADEKHLRHWYISRFLQLRQTAFQEPNAYFHRYASVSEKEAIHIAEDFWDGINLPNLRQNIFPTRSRAHLILRKNYDHAIAEVWFRKL